MCEHGHIFFVIFSASSMAFSIPNSVRKSHVNMFMDVSVGSAQVRSCGRHIDVDLYPLGLGLSSPAAVRVNSMYTDSTSPPAPA